MVIGIFTLESSDTGRVGFVMDIYFSTPNYTRRRMSAARAIAEDEQYIPRTTLMPGSARPAIKRSTNGAPIARQWCVTIAIRAYLFCVHIRARPLYNDFSDFLGMLAFAPETFQISRFLVAQSNDKILCGPSSLDITSG